MKKFFFIYATTCALLVSTAGAMEQSNPIIPDSFTQHGKKYMERSVERWVETAKAINITTGLATIFNDIEKVGIDALIKDPEVLEIANKIYNDMMTDKNKNCAEFFWFFTAPIMQRIQILRENEQSDMSRQTSETFDASLHIYMKALLLLRGSAVKTEDHYNYFYGDM